MTRNVQKAGNGDYRMVATSNAVELVWGSDNTTMVIKVERPANITKSLHLTIGEADVLREILNDQIR